MKLCCQMCSNMFEGCSTNIFQITTFYLHLFDFSYSTFFVLLFVLVNFLHYSLLLLRSDFMTSSSGPRWSWRPEESGGSRPREIGTHIVQPWTPPGGITPGPTPSTTHASSPAKSRQGSPDRRSPQKPVGRAAKSGRLELAIELAVLPQKNCSPTGVCTLALQQARRPSRLSNLFRW